MEIKVRKNDYGGEVVDCPFCKYWCYYRGRSPNKLGYLKRHIENEARKEALNYYLNESDGEIDHLKYYKEHTKEKVIKHKREYDSDLKLKK